MDLQLSDIGINPTTVQDPSTTTDFLNEESVPVETITRISKGSTSQKASIQPTQDASKEALVLDQNTNASQLQKPSTEDSIPEETRKKYASLEKRNAELEKSNKDFEQKVKDKQGLDTLLTEINEEIFSKDKGAYDRLQNRIKTKYNVDLPSYESAYKQVVNNPTPQQGTNPQAGNFNNQYQSPEEIKRLVSETITEKSAKDFEQRQAITTLTKEVPELAYTEEEMKIFRDKGEPTDAMIQKERIFSDMTARLPNEEKFLRDKYGWNLGKILVYLNRTHPDNIGKISEKDRKDGEIIGKQNALKAGVGTTAGIQNSKESSEGFVADISKLR